MLVDDITEALADGRARTVQELQFIVEQERVWLDEPVPALAGVTPRQAAADPTRRDDLMRLLDSYPPASAGTMDPDRLRAALGL